MTVVAVPPSCVGIVEEKTLLSLSPENVRWNAGTSTVGIHKKDDATHATAEPARSRHLRSTPLQMEVEDQECGACEKEYEGGHRWTARDRAVVAMNGAVPGQERKPSCGSCGLWYVY